jgi:F-box and leucine-rich repeat protein GRR1
LFAQSWNTSLTVVSEFTDHQRSVFCVFSGQGVVNLRKHFNTMLAAEEQARRSMRAALPVDTPIFPATAPAQLPPQLQHLESGFDDGDPDAIDEDDVPEDGSEMVIDTQPLLNQNNIGLGVDPTAVGAIPAPPPIPVPPPVNAAHPLAYMGGGHPHVIPVPIAFHGTPPTADEPMLQHHVVPTDQAGGFGNGDANQNSATASASANGHHHVTPVHAMIDISIPADELEQISQSGPAQGHQTPPTDGPGGT